MTQSHSVKRIAQAAAVLLLACTTIVRADGCAGGMDATGNECSDEQPALSLGAAVRGLSNPAPNPGKAELRIRLAKRTETLAEKRLVEAKLRQGEAAAAVTSAELSLIAARKAVVDAQFAPRL